MPKTIRNVFYKKLLFISFIEAHKRAKKNKTLKKEVLKFEMDLENNIISIMNNIKNKTYRIGKYREFMIQEPKARLIKSLPYIDRVVQQWYVHEFIKPYFVPRFIDDCYACIDNKGTHNAVDKIQKYMRKMKRNYGSYYILKCDIKRYFYTIDKNLLFNILSRRIKDVDLLEFTKLLIYEDTADKGIPIGNYTSQFFANIYLNVLDHYVKEELKLKYYVRYMDDFIMLLPTKIEAKETLEIINNFVQDILQLELNNKSRYYPNSMGVNFCGYRIFETHKLLRTRSKQTIKKKIKYWNKAYLNGTLDLKKFELQWNSWIAHSNHANTYNLQKEMYKKIKFPFKDFNEDLSNKNNLDLEYDI